MHQNLTDANDFLCKLVITICLICLLMSFFQSFHLTSDVLIDVLQLSTRRQMALLEPLSVDFQQLIGQFFSEKPFLVFEDIYCKFGLPDEQCEVRLAFLRPGFFVLNGPNTASYEARGKNKQKMPKSPRTSTPGERKAFLKLAAPKPYFFKCDVFLRTVKIFKDG